MSLPVELLGKVQEFIPNPCPCDYIQCALVNRTFASYFLSDKAWQTFNVYEVTDIARHYAASLKKANLLTLSSLFKLRTLPASEGVVVNKFKFCSNYYIQLQILSKFPDKLRPNLAEMLAPIVLKVWLSQSFDTRLMRRAQREVVDVLEEKVVHDKELYLALIARHVIKTSPWGYHPPEATSDLRFLQIALSSPDLALFDKDFVKPLRENKERAIAALMYSDLRLSGYLKCMSEDLKADPDVAWAALWSFRNGNHARKLSREGLEVFAKNFGDTPDFMVKAVGVSVQMFQCCSDRLLSDRSFILRVLRSNGLALSGIVPWRGFCIKQWRGIAVDEELVLTAIKSNASAVDYIPLHFLNSPSLMAQAVEKCPRILEHAPVEVRSDRAVVARAMEKNPELFKHASSSLRNDKMLALEAISKNYSLKRYVPDELQSDDDFLKQAEAKNRKL